MKLSEEAWNRISNIYQEIINHPFNQELMHGTLNHKKFSFYIEQDKLFLKAFAKSLAIISAKFEKSEHIAIFLKFAMATIAAEQIIIDKYLGTAFKVNKIESPTCLALNNFLLQTCLNEPVEVAIASVVPCFWLYLQNGQNICKYSKPTNPFAAWVSTYDSEDFANDVNSIIMIFDELADNSTPETKQQMINAFYQTAAYDLDFFEDAFNC
jgi:thiaminase/transcriptional activator TenA